MNERNRGLNVHVDSHVGRKKRLEENKRRFVNGAAGDTAVLE